MRKCKKCGKVVEHSKYANFCVDCTTTRKYMKNPLKEGINEGKNYAEYLAAAGIKK